jgi:hypothetical protein
LGRQGKGYRTQVIDGFEVLVGKGDADNDSLTFGVAESRDFWLHVAGVAGSHVIVRNPQDLPDLPRPVLMPRPAWPPGTPRPCPQPGKVEVHVSGRLT